MAITRPCKTLAQKIREPGIWRDIQPSEQWKVVQRRRYRNRLETTKGEAKTEPDSKFKAADIKVTLFINHVDKCTLAEDISKYIYEKTNVEVTLEKINAKRIREYDAYKVIVPKSKLTLFMDVNLWPAGITFRRFVSRFGRNEGELSQNIKP